MPDRFDKISKGNDGYDSLIESVNKTVSDIDEATKKIESLKDDLSKKNSSIAVLKKEYVEKVTKEDLEGNTYNKGNSQSIINEITNTNVIFNEQWNDQYRKDIFSEKPAVDIPDKGDVTYRYGNSDVYNVADVNTRTVKHEYNKIVFSGTNNGIRFEAVDSYEVVSPMGCTINGELIMAFLKLNIKYKDSDGSDLETLPAIDQLTETKTEYRLMMLTSNSTEWVDAPTDVYDLDGNLIGNLNNMKVASQSSSATLPDELSNNELYFGWSGGDYGFLLNNLLAFKSTDSNNIFLVYFCSAKKHAITILRLNRYRNCWDAVVNSKFGMDENGYIYEMFKKWFGKDIDTPSEAFPGGGVDRSRGNAILTGAKEFFQTNTKFPSNELSMDECFVKEDNDYKYYVTYVTYGVFKSEKVRNDDEYSYFENNGKQYVKSITKLGPTSSKKSFLFFTYKVSKKDGSFYRISTFRKEPLVVDCNLDVPVSSVQKKECLGWVINSPYDIHVLGGWWMSDPLSIWRIHTPSIRVSVKNGEPFITFSYIGQYGSSWSGHGYNDPGVLIVNILHKITFDIDGMNEERVSVYNRSYYDVSARSSSDYRMNLLSYSSPLRTWSLPYPSDLPELYCINRYPIHYISYNNKTDHNGLMFTNDFSIQCTALGDMHFLPNVTGTSGSNDIAYATDFSGMRYIGDIPFTSKYNYFPRTNHGAQTQYANIAGSLWIKNIDTTDDKFYGVIPYGSLSLNTLSYTLSDSFYTYLAPQTDGKVKESRFLFGKVLVPLVVGEVVPNNWMEKYPKYKTYVALVELSEIYGAYGLLDSEEFKLKDLVYYKETPTDYEITPESYIKGVIIPLEGTFDGTTREIVDVILRLRINGQYYSINNPPHFNYQDAAQTDSTNGLTLGAKQNTLMDPAISDNYMSVDNYNVYRYLVDTSSEIYFEMVLVKKDGTCTVMNIDKYGGLLENDFYDDIIKLGSLPGTGKTHDVLSENNVKTTVKYKPYTENGYTPFIIPEKTSLSYDDIVLYSERSMMIKPVDTVEGDLILPFKLRVDFTSVDGFKYFGLSRNCRVIIRSSGVGSVLEIETNYQKESTPIDIGDRQIIISVKDAVFYTWNNSLKFTFCVYVVSSDFSEPSQSVKNGMMEINGDTGYFSVSFENLLGVARKGKLPTIDVSPEIRLAQSSIDDFNARYVTLFTSLELQGTKSSPPIDTETGVWRIEINEQQQ